MNRRLSPCIKGIIAGSPLPAMTDCDGNFVLDSDDIDADGTLDLNENGLLDICSGDCNGNGHPDELDLDPVHKLPGAPTSQDWNGDGVPDECQPEIMHLTPGGHRCEEATPICPGVHYGNAVGATGTVFESRQADVCVASGALALCGLFSSTDSLKWYSYTPAEKGFLEITISAANDSSEVAECLYLFTLPVGCPTGNEQITNLGCVSPAFHAPGGIPTISYIITASDIASETVFYIAVGENYGMFPPDGGDYVLTIEGPDCKLQSTGVGLLCREDIGWESDPPNDASGHGPARLSACGPTVNTMSPGLQFVLDDVPLPLNTGGGGNMYEDSTLAVLAISSNFIIGQPAVGLTSGELVPDQSAPGATLIGPVTIFETSSDSGLASFTSLFPPSPIPQSMPVSVFAQVFYVGRGGNQVSNAVKIIQVAE